jgi:voltage-gated potassium channel
MPRGFQTVQQALAYPSVERNEHRMKWLLQRRFQALLVAFLLLLIVYPLSQSAFTGRVVFDVLVTVLFLAAMLVVFAERRLRVLAFLLGLPPVIGLWTGYVLPGVPRYQVLIVFHLAGALALTLAAVAILRVVYRQKTVSADSIYGAFAGYLMIGMTFSHLYSLIETVTPGSFHGGGDFAPSVEAEHGRYFSFVYFSLITLTTVGYGDITPVSQSAQAVAAVEAVAGQFFIAVLIAELMGKRVYHVLANQGSDSKKP